jgi:hypothetical protein
LALLDFNGVLNTGHYLKPEQSEQRSKPKRTFPMSAKRIVPVLVAAACLLQFEARANDIEPGKEFYTAIKTPNPIVLDGNLSEWRGAALLADPRFSIPKGSGDAGELVFFEEYNGGTWTGPDDHTSAVQVVYDDDNVYFGFVVTDDYHQSSATDVTTAWNGDSVQLMIANAARDTQIALYNYALSGEEGALGEIYIHHEAGPGGTDAVVTRNSTTKRTVYEIKLPKASLGLDTLEGGVRFGLGMAINDGDEDTPGQRGWGGLGAHSIVFGKSPEETALVTLARSNDIEPGKEYYTANPAQNPIVLDGSLGEWTGIPVLADPRFAIPKGSGRNGELVLFEEYNGGVWTGPDDHTSAVQIAYDADNVYFGFVVTDDYHENSALSAWNGDSVQLMIANANQDTQVALYNYALGGVEGALGEVIVNHEAGPGGTEAVVTRNGTTKRTTYEIKLPKAALDLPTLELGTQFGLGMAINDGDEDTPGQRGWGGLGAHSIVFGKTPQETALVTIGIGGGGADLLFFSAINPSIQSFSFRATDKGDSIVDPTSAKLFIDGVEVPLVASEKKVDAYDFTYTPTSPMAAGDHTYLIEVSDTNGNKVTDVNTFRLFYADIRPSMKAVSFDNTRPGFIWRVWQNETYVPNSLASAEAAIAGQLVDGSGNPVTVNKAYAAEVGPALAPGVVEGRLLRYEIPTVINLSQAANEGTTFFGYFNTTDDQMPGIPGDAPPPEGADGISAEIITFVEFPAGWVKLGVRSDDSVKAQAGYINNPADGVLLGQVDGNTADINLTLFVQEAGVYPLRVVYQEATGDAHLELFSFLADGITRVLLNDTANGGLRTYRTGVAPEKPTAVPEFTGIRINANGSITIEWTGGGTLQAAPTVTGPWQTVTGATSPYTFTPTAASLFGRLMQ